MLQVVLSSLPCKFTGSAFDNTAHLDTVPTGHLPYSHLYGSRPPARPTKRVVLCMWTVGGVHRPDHPSLARDGWCLTSNRSLSRLKPPPSAVNMKSVGWVWVLKLPLVSFLHGYFRSTLYILVPLARHLGSFCTTASSSPLMRFFVRLSLLKVKGIAKSLLKI